MNTQRDRIEQLRGVCKTAVGFLRDAGADGEAEQIAGLIGDMEPVPSSAVDSLLSSSHERLRHALCLLYANSKGNSDDEISARLVARVALADIPEELK